MALIVSFPFISGLDDDGNRIAIRNMTAVDYFETPHSLVLVHLDVANRLNYYVL